MKGFSAVGLIVALLCALCVSARAETFSIEKNDPRPFRIHGSPDETKATYAMMRELAAEVKRITGVEVTVQGYAPAFEGDFYVSTQPWAAKGAWFYRNRNGVMAIHGSDVAGTEAALRHFIDTKLRPVPTDVGRLSWTGLHEKHGPQWLDVRESTITAVKAKRAQEKAPEWENELVNYVNVEPARAYSFPLARVEDAFTEDLPETPWVKSLNGIWRYNWCGAPSLRPLDFYKSDFDDSKWYDIKVPSCVELQGFGIPIYSNIEYPHPAKPPYTDKDYNPVSSYRTTFTVPESWKGRPVFLRFEGVYSAYYVWMNGKKVGFSEDSCTAHEFNVTKYLKEGDNLLAVEVYRWSDGAYLEDQDFFRYSGIYRNVMLFSTPTIEIRDFHAKVDVVNNYKDAVIDLDVELRDHNAFKASKVDKVSSGLNDSNDTIGSHDLKAPKSLSAPKKLKDLNTPTDIKARLYDANYKLVGTFTRTSPHLSSFHLSVPNARLWSTEDPYLYTLVIQTSSANSNISSDADIRTCKLGFKKVEVKPSGAVWINGHSVKFKGVNRHDASPENGRSVSRAEMLRDVLLMKRFNIDTVRTSHYPNDPYFYHLCNRYGIWMQAEANVESHGMKYGLTCLASPPSWTQAHVDRCRDMVINWRNCPCIFSWSWGNEAGQGPSFDFVNEACAPLDTTLPMVYRQDCERYTWDGPGYPTIAYTHGRGLWKKTQFFFEYAHCMGNALGNFKEYWDEFYASDSLVGGCIWDWVDQAVWKYTDRLGPDGKRIRYLAYGGDHDEPNDGNFCANGIIDAERHVTPKLVEVGHVHRNLVVTKKDEGLELWNRFNFTNANAYDGAWEILEDGVLVKSGSFVVSSVKPGARAKLEIPGFYTDKSFGKPGREYLLNVSFALKEDTLWAPKGHVIARDQIVLSKWRNRDDCAPTAQEPTTSTSGGAMVPIAQKENKTTVGGAMVPIAQKGNKTTVGGAMVPIAQNGVSVFDEGDEIVVKAGATKAVFSRATGTLSFLAMNGKTILADRDGVVHGPRLTIMRALTDNDIWLRGRADAPLKLGFGNIFQSGLTQLRYHTRSLVVKGENTIRAEVEVQGAKSAGFTHVAEYVFCQDGSFAIQNDVTPYGRMPSALPRLGLSWMLEKAYENFGWYGRGPWENYVDRCTGSFLGRYASTVSEQYVAYVRPQDNGYKSDVREATLSDADGAGVTFSADVPFFVQALHYTWEDLEFARHRDKQQRIWNEKPPRDEVCLNLDIRQLGLGGASCGPRPEPQYIFPIQPEAWTIHVAPAKKGCAK